MLSALVIPDIHNRIDLLDRFLEKNRKNYDSCYFLGDYFDDWNDTPDMVQRVAWWLKQQLEIPGNYFCMGNHDYPYRLPYNQSVSCPGFTPEKSLAIGKELNNSDWTKFKLAHVVDGWLLSHAGVRADIVGQPFADSKITLEGILAECNKAQEAVECGGYHRLLLPGGDRGVRNIQPYGGITWLDWRSLLPIEGINQIVGHSILGDPQVRWLCKDGLTWTKKERDWVFKYRKEVKRPKSVNWCIDTNSRHFGIIREGVFTVHTMRDNL